MVAATEAARAAAGLTVDETGGKDPHVRRFLGIATAVVALAAAVLGSQELEAERSRTVEREVRRAAEGAGQRASDGLAAHVAELKLKAENAAANPRMVFALEGGADERTLRDLWRTEEWWRPWRTEFKVYALSFEGPRADVVEGIAPTDMDAESLIRRARDRREAVAEIVLGKGWPYAAAATAVTVPRSKTPPVLILAKPIDQAALRKLADKAGGAVALSDGRTALVDAGPDRERELLKQAFGSEGRGALFQSPDGSWAAAVAPVTPGLWLWTYAAGGSGAHEAAAAATGRKRVLWVIMIPVAAIALVIGMRRPRPLAGFPASGGAGALPGSGLSSQAGMPAAGPLGGGVMTPPGPARASSMGSMGSRGAMSPDRPITGDGATELGHAPAPAIGAGSAVSGVTFGRYTLLDRLGEGGMGEVFTAVTFGAEGFRRRFVVKRLRAELARDPVVVAQFIDEANLASTFVHSNIVPVFDFGKVGDEYFLAQEYILGRDLARITRRSIERENRPLAPAVALCATAETLKALEYAHTKTGENGQPLGIVHRDVSPTNVMVSARGEVKLFDFGIVKAEGRVTKTQSGVVKGNVTFMSPEQARGANVDARADLFSLGLVLYYCLRGEALYQGNTTYDLLIKAASGPGADELALIDQLPHPCGPILRRALAVPLGDRFQTAHEFLGAVQGHVAGGASELAAAMHRWFDEDFRAEEGRFGPTPTGGGGGNRGGNTQEMASRRTS
jgi:hypothetical protein